MSGLALVVAGAYFSGYLAALAVPKAYFAFFGREHRTLAWCWLTLRPAASSIKEAAWFCFGGIVLGFAYEEWLSAIALRAAEDLPNPSSFFTYLWRVVPAWRALPNVLAFPVGLLAAFALVRRSNITRQAHTPAP